MKEGLFGKRRSAIDTRRHRVRRPPPTDGFLMADLAALAGVAVVTIKAYVRRGLLARVKFYGPATRYPRGHLVRLLAIRLVRAGGVRQLDTLRRKLNAWAPADMERWILTHPLEPATLAALGYPSTGQGDNPLAVPGAPNESIANGGFAASGEPRTGVAPTASGAAAPNVSPSVLPTESWRHVTLMAGLELQVKGDAGPLVDRVAEQLVAHFAQMLTTRAAT